MEAIKPSDFNRGRIEETVLIGRILNGEKELFEILVKRNNQKLYRVIRSYLRDNAEIEDVMQDAYLKAYEKLFQFRQSAGFSTWLVRIGIHEALARLRQKGRMYTMTDQNEKHEGKSVWEDHTTLNPEVSLMRHEARLMLEGAIDGLDQKYRTVYVLKEVEMMSIQDVADCLDMSVSNVKVRLHRAKGMLRERLLELAHGPDLFGFGGNRCDRVTERVMNSLR